MPSGSLAAADIVMLLLVGNEAPFVGLIILTVGGALVKDGGTALTVMVTAALPELAVPSLAR